MESSVLISIISGFLGLTGIIGAAFVGLRQTKITAKSADQQTNISGVNAAITGLDTLAKQHSAEIERVTSAHNEYVKKCDMDRMNFASEIGKQAGQIEVLKSIPLVNIDTTLQEIAKFNKVLADSNTLILERLNATADIAAEDRDVLTNQNLHIKKEVKKIMDEDK